MLPIRGLRTRNGITSDYFHYYVCPTPGVRSWTQ